MSTNIVIDAREAARFFFTRNQSAWDNQNAASVGKLTFVYPLGYYDVEWTWRGSILSSKRIVTFTNKFQPTSLLPMLHRSEQIEKTSRMFVMYMLNSGPHEYICDAVQSPCSVPSMDDMLDALAQLDDYCTRLLKEPSRTLARISGVLSSGANLVALTNADERRKQELQIKTRIFLKYMWSMCEYPYGKLTISFAWRFGGTATSAPVTVVQIATGRVHSGEIVAKLTRDAFYRFLVPIVAAKAPTTQLLITSDSPDEAKDVMHSSLFFESSPVTVENVDQYLAGTVRNFKSGTLDNASKTSSMTSNNRTNSSRHSMSSNNNNSNAWSMVTARNSHMNNAQNVHDASQSTMISAGELRGLMTFSTAKSRVTKKSKSRKKRPSRK
jgi:hypothetical protein